MSILVILGISWFTIGLSYLLYNFGIQPSLSQYYYCLNNKYSKGHWFYLYLMITVILLVVPLCEICGSFGFLSVLGLSFVGASAAFSDDKMQGRVHLIGAIVSAIGAILCLFMLNMLKWAIPVTIIVLILAWATKTMKQSYIFWLEMICFYSLFLALILLFV